MNLDTLAANLRTQASAKSALVLDATVFPAAVLDDLRTAFALAAGANLTVTGVRAADIPDPVGGRLTIAGGKASVLNQKDVGIALTFAASGEKLEAVIVATMSTSWTFSDSFKELAVFPFQSLKLSNPHFVYATTPRPQFSWPGESSAVVPLAAGMNFLSYVTLAQFSVVTDLVGKLMGVAPLKLYGPFGPKAGEQLPVGTLTAPLTAGTFGIGAPSYALTLGSPEVAVSIGTSDDLSPNQNIDLLVQGVFNQALKISVGIPESGGTLAVSSAPLPHRAAIGELIESLPGGKGFTSYIPSELSAVFAHVGLDNFAMTVAPGPRATYLRLAIGTLESWSIIPDVLVLNGLSLQIESVDPAGLDLRRAFIQADASFLPHIFPGVFEFTVELKRQNGWQIETIAGAYYGAVNLGDIVGGLLGNQNSVPSALRAISFSNFGVDVVRPSGAPATYRFFGEVETAFPILGQQLAAQLTLAVEKTAAEYRIALSGALVIGEQVFTLSLDLASAGKSLHAQWKNQGQPLGFATIAAAFGWDMPSLPENLDLALTDAEFFYDFGGGTLALRAHSARYGNILFVSLVAPETSPDAGQRKHVFALDVPLNLDLSSLPVIGERLPSSVKAEVKNLQVIVASGALNPIDMTALNGVVARMLQDVAFIPKTLASGVTFATQLLLGGSTQPVIVPLTSSAASAPAPRALTGSAAPVTTLAVADPEPAPTTTSYKAGAKWFNVQKSFGPAHFERIGVQYQEGALFFLLDASLTFSALSFSLDGLGVGSPLKRFEPQPHLDGLAVSFRSGPVAIEGGLRVVPKDLRPKDVAYQYLGAVTIEIEPYLISGVASYAKVAGSSSFFVFAQVKGNFGGPPAFFITGFMGGFGYNSQLTLPPPDKVYQFPFVAGLDNPAIFGPDPTPMTALTVLSGGGGKPPVVTPASGESWIAAGVLFRSFELVFGRALVVAQFGREFQVSLLGLASASLPQGRTNDAYAYLEMQLQAVFRPDDGVFSVIASLTPASFVITRDCKLTGGFAFCMWFGSNPHAGDFVVSVGGYHPAFAVPAWYPRPAPVGFNWRPSGSVTIKGGAYFALTPSAIMAGGGLEVLFESGAIRAWFTAYANLLVTWKPFHFVAGIGMSLGASVRVDLLFTTVTLSFELGATLELWGPPTGGVVHVHLYIVSFSVDFGSSSDDARTGPLGWNDFKTLLPQNHQPAPVPRTLLGGMDAAADGRNAAPEPAVLGVHVNRGLSRQDSEGAWVVRADELIFTTETAVPATAVTFGGNGKAPPLAPGAKPVTPPPKINIRPMAKSGVTSTHKVTLTSIDDGKTVDLSVWTQVPQTRNLPEAMWGKVLPGQSGADATPPASSATVPNLPVGTRLIAPPAKAGAASGPMAIDSLIVRLGGGWQPFTPAKQADPIPAPVVDPKIVATIATTLASAASQTAQQNLVAALKRFDAAPRTNAPLKRLADQAGETYSEPPLRAA